MGMKGFNPHGAREELVPVIEPKSNGFFLELIQVFMLFFVVRISMLVGGFVFMTIPYIDPVAQSVIKIFQPH